MVVLRLAACIVVLAATAAVAGGPEPGFLVRARHAIERSEYEVRWSDSRQEGREPGWQAPNRAQGFRARFTREGLVLEARSGDAWNARVAWTTWGEGPLPPADVASAAPRGARVELARDAHRERFANAPEGLLVELELAAPPSVAPAELRLAVAGALTARVGEPGRSIVLAEALGRPVLRLELRGVTDAAGRAHPAFLRPSAGELSVSFEAEGATWPVTVALEIASAAWTRDGTESGAGFAAAVAGVGDVNGDGFDDVAIGVPGFDPGLPDAGRVLLYYGSASGPAEAPAWHSDGTQAGAAHGTSVAAAGDVNGDGIGDLLTGAPLHDRPGAADAGRASLFLGSPAGPDDVSHWTYDGLEAGSRLGSAVAAAGDVDGDGHADVVVGAPKQDGFSGTDTGVAYLFRGSAAGLADTPSWFAEGDRPGSEFGASVATAGDVNGDGFADVAIGAPGRDTNLDAAGRALAYHGAANGLAFAAAWIVDGTQAGEELGRSVGTAGDVDGDGLADLIVGAPGHDGEFVDAGLARIFVGTTTGLSVVADWSLEGRSSGRRLGSAVSTAGDVNGDGYADVVVGAPSTSDDATWGGGIEIHFGGAGGPDLIAEIEFEESQPGALLGAAVALAGDTDGDGLSEVLAAAPGYDGEDPDVGRAVALFGGTAAPAPAAAWFDEPDQAQAEFGTVVATAGDVNGDGFAELLVGSRLHDAGQSNEGRAYVYLGSASGLPESPLVADGNQTGAEFGTSVASAGDVNGDGYDDVIVGAPFWDGGLSNEGAAFVYHGSATGLSASPVWSIVSGQANARLGGAVAAAGDVNGDGYGDVLVGADSWDGGSTDEGRVSLFLGSPSGLATTAAWFAEANVGGAFLGACAGAGDVDGDGYSDVVVGASAFSGDLANEGLVQLYRGSPFGPSLAPDWSRQGDQAGARFGFSVAGAGDVDGDGFADVIVGAPLADGTLADEGRATLFRGSPAGLATDPAWSALGGQADARLGLSVGTAGDVDANGFADVIVGAPGHDGPETNEGRAYVFLGSVLGLATDPAWFAESDQAEAAFGRAVSTAGDVNGDGFADVAVGARSYDHEQSNEGRVFVYYGNAGAGVPLAPQQRRADDAAPIARLGATAPNEGFRLGLGAHSPFGRTVVRLEHAVAPLGTPLDSATPVLGDAALDTDSAARFDEEVVGLEPDTPYRWRMRTRYDPSSVPFQGRSRWVGVPWGGEQETDLRTGVEILPAGGVPDGAEVAGPPLVIDKVGDGTIVLEWGGSCSFTDDDYAVYEGDLGQFGSYDRLACTTAGAASVVLPLEGPSVFWLVVPHNGEREGSYGLGVAGAERPPASRACLPQLSTACP